MAFGGQVITFVTLATVDGPVNDLGQRPLAEARTAAPGCRHRPLTFDEATALGYTVASQMWRSTVPLHEYTDPLLSTVLSLGSGDAIEVDGVRYQVDGGIRPHPDMAGRPYKATVISKLQFG